MNFCSKCNNTGATNQDGILDCLAPLCTAAQDRANLDKWMLREGYGQSGIRDWAIHQYAVRTTVESAALLLEENERLRTELEARQARIEGLTLELATRQPSQPVQQPAAVAGQEPVAWLVQFEYLAGVTKRGPALKVVEERWGKQQFVTDVKSEACLPEEYPAKEVRGFKITPLYIAPVPVAETELTYDQIFQRGRLSAIEDYKNVVVPAASVHDAQEQIHIGTRLRRVAKAAGVTVDYGDVAFYYAGAFSILGDIARTLEKTAAGVQGDTVIGFPDPEAVFTMFCDREGFPSDGDMDEALRKAFYEGTKLGHPAPSILPDSGRDAALEEAAGALDILCYGAENGAGGTVAERLRQAQRTIRALAAHPAPSSDAALTDEQIITIARRHNIAYPAPGEFFSSEGKQEDEVIIEFVKEIIAAHPANGAQAGITDTDRINFMGRMGFTNLGRYSGMMQVVWMDDILDRHLTNGKDAREALDAAILAAAKKGN